MYEQEMLTGEKPAEEAAEGNEICIMVGTGGEITVQKKPDGEVQQVADIKEALTLALDLYKEISEGESGEDAFGAGFGAGPAKSAPPVERGMME